MIHIEKNQPVPEHPELIVFSPTGDYDDNALIECATTEQPSVAFCGFAASFVKYGGFVYRFENPEKLGKALVELDPASTHDSVKLFRADEARRLKRERGDFSLDESPVEQQAAAPEAPAPEPTPTQPEPEPLTTQNPNNTSTTTPVTSTTTPPVQPPPPPPPPPAPVDTSTTTPPVSFDPTPGDTSTTTPPTFGGDTPTTTPKFDPTPVLDSIKESAPIEVPVLDSTTTPAA
jgi:hypothetical protein